MKGRGTRVIDPHELRTVTPDAKAKTHFVLVDAVGVTQSAKNASRPIERAPTVSFEKLLEKVARGNRTDAVKAHLIPPEVTPAQAAITYANEADLLNVALFGRTAKQWRDSNPKLDGNMRDHATIEQLLVLANLEGMNAELIHMTLPQPERLKRLNQIAIRQMQSLTATDALRQLQVPRGRKV